VSRRLVESDLEALSIGAAILGTGGGGNPYIGRLRARELLRQGLTIELVSLEELDDDAQVTTVGGIGAPVVGIEKFEHGDECLRALRAIERVTGTKVDAVIPAEIGGANSMEPMITAAQAGLPVVDADGMGRAFPEVQMCTYYIYGHEPAPAALADDKGNQVVIQRVQDMYRLERLARLVAVDMGAAAGFAEKPMRGEFLKRYAVPNTVTQALELGEAVLTARRERRDPVEAVLERERGKLLFHGKIIDVRRELKGGFAVGSVRLDGLDDWRGQGGRIDIQNENLVFLRDDVVEACVPDLIIVLDVDTGMPITTEVLRYGQRVAVLALPCHPLLRTPQALEVVGPAAFGYHDVTYRPLELERTAHAIV
jgi:DUF917 family protein